MLPVLQDGDLISIDAKADFAIGDIVVARHPFKKSSKVLKRISVINADKKYFLTGDNVSESTDSRTLGAILRKDILGKVICRIS